jgi:hypothetical protein
VAFAAGEMFSLDLIDQQQGVSDHVVRKSMLGHNSIVSASLSIPDVLVMASSKGGLYAATMLGEKLWNCGDGPCDI